MSIGDDRRAFSKAVGALLMYAHFLGYEVAIEDVRATSGHRPGSWHEKALAIDINLYKEGVWQQKSDGHRELGEFWERIGGTWGGRWDDGNHYSWKEGRQWSQ